MPAKARIGVPLGSHQEQNAREAAQLYAQGQSIRAIAEHFGLSYGGTHRLLQYAGVTFRGRGGNTRAPKEE